MWSQILLKAHQDHSEIGWADNTNFRTIQLQELVAQLRSMPGCCGGQPSRKAGFSDLHIQGLVQSMETHFTFATCQGVKYSCDFAAGQAERQHTSCGTPILHPDELVAWLNPECQQFADTHSSLAQAANKSLHSQVEVFVVQGCSNTSLDLNLSLVYPRLWRCNNHGSHHGSTTGLHPGERRHVRWCCASRNSTSRSCLTHHKIVDINIPQNVLAGHHT
mmetsp:Transcript_9101/g.22865  ORF Transcript_9101/g.22865 Transcript_9101/m.22865 type:complete len:219 (+) Transcript_9101:1421-2077(+)